MKYRASLLALLLAGALTLPVSAVAVTVTQQTSQDNSAPIAEHLTLTTYRDVAIASRFAAVDPDGDAVTFQIVDSPARGQVTVDETDTAAFWYTPYEGKKGKDSFTYVAVDSNGNVSEPATVSITIEKQSTKVFYSDMEGDAAHYAALRLAETGVYVGRQLGNLYYFDPQDTFSREEFLAMAMSVAGVDPLADVTITGFYDDQSIPTWAKGYVSAALMDGTVRGSYNDQKQIVFNSGSAITVAEATVMIDRLLNVSDVSVETSASGAVPAWASQAAANMETVSVLPAQTDLTGTLTRAQAAQMLCSMQELVNSREDSGWFW